MSQRTFGLDLLRAAAILLVLACHTLLLVETENHLIILFGMWFGTLGVELFFVLSGFLIGQILIRELAPNPDASHLFTFWIRRWFRTLPNFYLFLGLNVLVAPITGRTIPKILPFITFTQNFAWPHPAFFDVAWSLAIEEWFYLLFPLALILLAKFKLTPKVNLFSLIALVITGSFIARGYIISVTDAPWDAILRKAVVYRFDSLILGVLAAGIKIYLPNFWGKQKLLSVASSLLLLAFLTWCFLTLDWNSSFIFRLAFLPATSLTVFLLLPALDRLQSAEGTVARFVTKISLWSYSLYLVQGLFLDLFVSYRRGEPPLGLAGQMAYGSLFAAACLITSLLCYRFWEKPTTDLRGMFRR